MGAGEETIWDDCCCDLVGTCLRMSRSSKSDSTSEMSPSEGSLSDTSSMRACDIVVVLGVGVYMRRGR